jgi:hypothetical protein
VEDESSCRAPLRLAKRIALFVGAVCAAYSPALAQYPPPGSIPEPGAIVISRDVPQRPAFAPGQPGSVTTVQASPVDTIFGVTGAMVSVLSDGESADIAAGIQAQRGVSDNAFMGADAALNPQIGGGLGEVATQSFGGAGLSNTISGAVENATGAISSSLGALSALGGSQ